MKNTLLKTLIMFKVILFLLFTALVGSRIYTELLSKGKIYTIQDSPSQRVAIVFGAGLTRSGLPTPVLRDRVRTAAELYFSGRVEKLLMSGDNRTINYNEPAAMRDFAISLGVPEQDIVLDYAGRRTYDTCYRARDIFGIQNAALVTQQFHLPRALFLCNHMGVNAFGVAADQREYRKSSLIMWQIREIPATLTALWDVWIRRPLPVLGKQEPIFPQNTTTE
jgi:SanA protein